MHSIIIVYNFKNKKLNNKKREINGAIFCWIYLFVFYLFSGHIFICICFLFNTDLEFYYNNYYSTTDNSTVL